MKGGANQPKQFRKSRWDAVCFRNCQRHRWNFISLDQGDFPMKLFHTMALSMVAVLACGLSSAQALPPIGKEVKEKPKIKQPAPDETLKHGMKLVVNLNAQPSVRGTAVWADNSGDYLM